MLVTARSPCPRSSGPGADRSRPRAARPPGGCPRCARYHVLRALVDALRSRDSPTTGRRARLARSKARAAFGHAARGVPQLDLVGGGEIDDPRVRRLGASWTLRDRAAGVEEIAFATGVLQAIDEGVQVAGRGVGIPAHLGQPHRVEPFGGSVHDEPSDSRGGGVPAGRRALGLRRPSRGGADRPRPRCCHSAAPPTRLELVRDRRAPWRIRDERCRPPPDGSARRWTASSSRSWSFRSRPTVAASISLVRACKVARASASSGWSSTCARLGVNPRSPACSSMRLRRASAEGATVPTKGRAAVLSSRYRHGRRPADRHDLDGRPVRSLTVSTEFSAWPVSAPMRLSASA